LILMFTLLLLDSLPVLSIFRRYRISFGRLMKTLKPSRIKLCALRRISLATTLMRRRVPNDYCIVNNRHWYLDGYSRARSAVNFGTSLGLYAGNRTQSWLYDAHRGRWYR